MARKPFIAGNWKMNNTIEQGVNLVNALKTAKNKNNADIMVAPSFTAINAVAQALKGTGYNGALMLELDYENKPYLESFFAHSLDCLKYLDSI